MGKRGPYDRRRMDIKLALELGWEFCGTSGGGHLQFKHPLGGPKATISKSPSDHRALKNSAEWFRKNTPREE